MLKKFPIANVLRDPTHDQVNFIWHGGEPTILPIRFYEKALLVQARLRRPNQIITNVIQSNGTRLSPEWIKFIRNYNFGLGISLDGPPEIHDIERIYASGRPSFQDINQNIKLLRKNRILFSVLMVIDERALKIGPEAIFNFFIKAEINSYGLIAAMPANYPDALPNTQTHHYTDPQKMNKFLIKIYDLWKERADPNIKIREINGILQRLNGKSVMCTLAGKCLGKYYMIDPNGDISHCDLFIGDSNYSFGNLLESSFVNIRNNKKLKHLIESNKQDLIKMQYCDEFNTCNGWCPHERYLSIRHNPHHNQHCCGLRDLIKHIRNNMPKFITEKNKALNTEISLSPENTNL